MKKILCLCALLAAMLVGCSKDMDTVPEIADDNTPKPELKLIGGSNRGRKTILGEKLNNPYSLSNMSSSLTSLSSTRSEFAGASIKANALYVRFLPQNMEDVAYLENQRSLTLFDHPLDYELEVIGDYYQDPEIPEGQITWLYTTVGVDFQFPGHIRYEILEPVYIPNFINEKGQLVSQPYDSDLECLAFQRCGYGDMVPAANPTPAGLFDTPVNPVGRISIWDENKQQMVGLRYVQVTTRWGLNFSSTYTDRDGRYRIPRPYQCNPQYYLSFENGQYKFNVYGNWGPVLPAQHNMRYQTRYGYSVCLFSNSQAWDWGVVNNAASAYFEECVSRSYAMPPQPFLRIYCLENESYGSAPMLSEVGGAYNVDMSKLLDWLKVKLKIDINLVAKFLPDIFIGTASNNYERIFTTTVHELSHASHFRQAGPSYWQQYIQYILNCWNDGLATYGDRLTANNGRCGVGEIWGHFSGRWFFQYYQYGSPNENYPNSEEMKYWFKPQIFWELAYYDILTPRQLFNCLTADVTTMELLLNKMMTTYPDKAKAIEKIFRKHYPLSLIELPPIIID